MAEPSPADGAIGVSPQTLLESAEKLLGEGGMARVLLGFDPLLRRRVAVKVQKNRSSSTDIRFICEAQILAQLQHPGLVPVYTLGRSATGEWFYAMRPIKGQTLADVLNLLRQRDPQATHRYNVRRLASIFVRVCETVDYAHRCGVIHRDLKPSNIMLDEFGAVLVMDWGLAKVTGKPLGGDPEPQPQVDVSKSATDLAGSQPLDEPVVSVNESNLELRPLGKVLPNTGEELLDSTGSGAPLVDDRAGAGVRPPAAGQVQPVVVSPPPLRLGGSAAAVVPAPLLARGTQPARAPTTESGSMLMAPMLVTVGDSPEQDFAADITQEGHTVGSPGYMSPEQMQHADSLDHRTDIYALGATLYEMLTLRRPHTAATLPELLKVKLSGAKHPAEVAPYRHIPDVLANAAIRSLVPDPAERFGSLTELIEILNAYLEGSTLWKPLRDDRFNRAQIVDGWKSRAGTWVAKRSALVQTDPDADAELVLTPSIEGGVRVEVEARVPPGRSGGIGILLSYAIRRPHAYVFRFGTAVQGLSTLTKGHATVASSAVFPEVGRWYRVTAERQDDTLTLSVDGETILEYVDEEPLTTGHVGLCCYGASLEVRRVRVWTSGTAQQVSCLAVPDALREVGKFDAALAHYDRIASDLAQDSEGGRANFRAGLCELEMGRVAAADSRFRELCKTTRWSHYGYRGLAAIAARNEDWTSEIAGLKDAIERTVGEVQQSLMAELEQRAWHFHEYLGHQPAAQAAHTALLDVRAGGVRGLDFPTSLRIMDVAFGGQDWKLVRLIANHLVEHCELPDICLHALMTSAQADYLLGQAARAREKLVRAASYREAAPVVWQLRRMQWLAMMGHYDLLPGQVALLLPNLRKKVHHADELLHRADLVLQSVLLLPQAQTGELLEQIEIQLRKSRRLQSRLEAAKSLWHYWHGDTATADAISRAVMSDYRAAYDSFLPVPLFLAARTGQQRYINKWADGFASRSERPFDLQPTVARLIRKADATSEQTQKLLDPLDWRRKQRVATTLGELAMIEGREDRAVQWFELALSTLPGSRLFPSPWAAQRLGKLTGQRVALAADPDVPKVLLTE